MQLFITVMAALVYALEWDYPGFLGDWAGMTTSWLRLKPAKTEITERCRRRVGVETTGRISLYQPFHPTEQPFIHKSSLQRRGLVRDKADTTLQPHQRAFFLCLRLVKSVRPLISDVDF